MSTPGVPVVLSEDPAPSSGLTDGDVAIRSDGSKVQFFENNHWHTPTPPMVALVDDYGVNGASVGGGVTDDTQAILNAIEKLRAAGGGRLRFTPNQIYKVTSEICVGVRFTDPLYIRPGIDWSNSGQNPSLDSGKLALAVAYPSIEVEGNGAVIWGYFDNANQSPIFSYFIVETSGRSNQASYGCTGLIIVGKEGYTAGNPPTANFASTPSTFPSANKQVGFFSVFSPCSIRDIEVRECYRGIVTSDSYSSYSYKETASHCYDGISHFSDNSAVRMKLKATLCTNVGFKFSGQSPNYHGFLTEQCAVDLEVLTLDGGVISGVYSENTTAAHTDYGFKLGDTTNAAQDQVINLVIITGHLARTYGKSVRFHSSDSSNFINFRTSSSGGSVFNNSHCSAMTLGYILDVNWGLSNAGASYVNLAAGYTFKPQAYGYADRDALSPRAGEVLFTSDRNQLNVFNGSTWDELTSDGSLTPNQYGAIGNNSNDDTAGIQSAINYAKIRGKFIRLPANTYRISSKLVIQDVYGFNFLGSGRDGCILKWIGSSGQPMIEIINSQNVNIGRLQMIGNTTGANRPEAFIQSSSDTSGSRTYVPTNNIFRDILMGTGSASESNYGIKYINNGVSSDTNNSEGIFENVKIQGVVEGCIYLGHAQSKAHHFRSCEFTLGKYGVYQASGSFTWHGGNVSAMTVAAFYVTSANDVITVKDCTSETCDRFFVATPAGNSWTIQLLGNRMAADAVNADKRIILIGTKGPNIIKGNTFDTAACKIATNWQSAGGMMIVEDNSFGWVSSNVATIFEDANQIGTWVTDPNVYLDAGGVAALRALKVVSTGGALHGNEKAGMEISSTTKGFMNARMTTTQRNAMSLGVGDAGMEIFNVTTGKKNFWNGTAWEAVTSV